MIVCPFCYGNGVIQKAQIKGTQKKIYICDECDLVWLNENINDDCYSFDYYMKSLGLKGLWENLIDIHPL